MKATAPPATRGDHPGTADRRVLRRRSEAEDGAGSVARHGQSDCRLAVNDLDLAATIECAADQKVDDIGQRVERSATDRTGLQRSPAEPTA